MKARTNSATHSIMDRQRKEFAERLKSLRKKAGMTQQQLADKAGIIKPVIGRYETGGSMPRDKALQNLATALNVSVSALTGSSSPFDDAYKREILYCLNDYGVETTLKENDIVLLNIKETDTKIELPFTELKKIMDKTDKETAAFFKPSWKKYFHKALLYNLFFNTHKKQ